MQAIFAHDCRHVHVRFRRNQPSWHVCKLYDDASKSLGRKIYGLSTKVTLVGWGLAAMNRSNLPSSLALALAVQYSTFVPPRGVLWRVEIRFGGGASGGGRLANAIGTIFGGGAAGGGCPASGIGSSRLPSGYTQVIIGLGMITIPCTFGFAGRPGGGEGPGGRGGGPGRGCGVLHGGGGGSGGGCNGPVGLQFLGVVCSA